MIHALLHRTNVNIITKRTRLWSRSRTSLYCNQIVLPSGSKHATQGVISRTNQAVS